MKRRSKKTSRKEKRDSNTVIIVDASALGYAAFHTMGHLSYNGQSTGVIYGFLHRILQLAKKFNTNNFITCWDAGRSHRYKAYPQYKWRRWQSREQLTELEKKEYESLTLQMMELNHFILPQMGFKNNFIQLEYEADDLIGYWISKLKNSGKQIILVTTDNDMYQCLDHCDIWFPTKKKFFRKKDMIEKFGITPSQWPLAKAIGGCSGDGIAGIEGVGDPKSPKSMALKYIRGELKKGKIFDKIESKEGQAIINRNLPLVSVPYYPEGMERMILRRNKYNKKSFIKIFGKYYFKSFLGDEKFKEWERAFKL